MSKEESENVPEIKSNKGTEATKRLVLDNKFKQIWKFLPKKLKYVLKLLLVSGGVLVVAKQGFEIYVNNIVVPNKNNLDNFKLMYPYETVDFLKTLVKFYEKDSPNNVFNPEVNDEVMKFLSRVKEECTNGIFSEQDNLSFVRTALISELNKDLPQNPIIDMQYAEGICTIRFSDGTQQSFYAEKVIEDLEGIENPKVLPDKIEELLEAEQSLGKVICELKNKKERISKSDKEELVSACEDILINGAYKFSYNKNNGEFEVNYQEPNKEAVLGKEVNKLMAAHGINVIFDCHNNTKPARDAEDYLCL